MIFATLKPRLTGRVTRALGAMTLAVGVLTGLPMGALLTDAAAPDVFAQAQTPPPAAQDEFVPLKDVPPTEQLPAARLVMAAYSVAWIVIAGYIFLLWRRLSRVEQEIQTVGQRFQASRR